ncbi:MAG: hypothetical protein ACRCVG_02890 [Methanobacteriaceae archaeon]
MKVLLNYLIELHIIGSKDKNNKISIILIPTLSLILDNSTSKYDFTSHFHISSNSISKANYKSSFNVVIINE